MQDIGFNSIMCRDNRALGEIADLLGRDRGEIDEWGAQTARGIREKLWSREYGRFESYDLGAGRFLDSPTAMGFMPLYAGVVESDQSERLFHQMDSVSFCGLRQGNCFTIPDYDMTAEGYSEVNYWRGPVWLNINWMLAQGLEEYGFFFEAQLMRKDILELAVRFGFREYYDSRKGEGLGSKQFSWSAALFIDVLSDYYRQRDAEPHLPGIVLGGRLGHTRVLNQAGHAPRQTQDDPATAVSRAIGDLAEAYFDGMRGTVDYAGIAHSGQFQRYLEAVALLPGLDPASLGKGDEAKAFWINLFNLLVIHGVIELKPDSSVREVPDFFDRLAYQVGGRRYSLNDMAHGILRGNRRAPRHLLPPFLPWDARRRYCLEPPDLRVHFALSRGARSCPKLAFYQAANLEEQLKEAATSYVSSEVLVDPEENRVALAEVFSWYVSDFGGQEGLLSFVAGLMPEGEHKSYLLANLGRVRVEYLFHDWHLNR